MKNKNIIILILGMIFLLAIMQNISGEVFMWNTVTTNNITNITNFYAYYQFEDTSTTGIGSGQDTKINFRYHVEPLPLDLTGDNLNFGEIDYCNLTITHTRNIYGTTFVAFEGFSGGQLLNTTIETQKVDFGTNAGVSDGTLFILMRDKDSVVADMKCHHTKLEGLYENNILAGSFTTYMSSYECSQCKDFSLEELSHMAETNENITANQISVYSSVQKVVDFNWQIWLILSWIIKIGLVVVGIGLIFAGVYYFYTFFQNIGGELSR